MDDGLIVTSIIAAVIGAIAGFLASSLTKRHGDRPKDVSALILLYGAGGSRAAKVVPEVIYAHPGRLVEWIILDTENPSATDEQRIDIVWDVDLDETHGPLREPPEKKPKRLKGRIRGNPQRRKYRYTITEDGNSVADPDVEIMM